MRITGRTSPHDRALRVPCPYFYLSRHFSGTFTVYRPQTVRQYPQAIQHVCDKVIPSCSLIYRNLMALPGAILNDILNSKGPSSGDHLEIGTLRKPSIRTTSTTASPTLNS